MPFKILRWLLLDLQICQILVVYFSKMEELYNVIYELIWRQQREPIDIQPVVCVLCSVQNYIAITWYGCLGHVTSKLPRLALNVCHFDSSISFRWAFGNCFHKKRREIILCDTLKQVRHNTEYLINVFCNLTETLGGFWNNLFS